MRAAASRGGVTPAVQPEIVIKPLAADGSTTAAPADPRVIMGRIVRVRRRHAVAFVERPVRKPVVADARPSRAATLLATAHRMQEMIDRGDVEGPADLARRLGVSRARVTQILNMALLPPRLQDDVLFVQSSGGRGAQPHTGDG